MNKYSKKSEIQPLENRYNVDMYLREFITSREYLPKINPLFEVTNDLVYDYQLMLFSKDLKVLTLKEFQSTCYEHHLDIYEEYVRVIENSQISDIFLMDNTYNFTHLPTKRIEEFFNEEN